jgi:predicted RNase H-like HicB family nuclease
MKRTAVFQRVREGYVGFVEELPGANAQARTLEEARANLAEAVEFVLEANRSLAEKAIGKMRVIREPLVLASIRLPVDVIERWKRWKTTGPGWQTRIAKRLSKNR